MNKLNIKVLLVVLLLFITSLVPLITQASFGISPPYVRNDNLQRGSTYSQKIVIVRSDDEAKEAWKIIVTPDLTDFKDWFSVDKGMEFVIPAGEEAFPIVVSVKVPNKANLQNYTGALRLKGYVDKPFDEGISLALGARIDVDLTVNDMVIEDFKVRSIKMYDIEALNKMWWGSTGGIVKFNVSLENVGNIKISPSKIELDIYNSSNGELLERLTNYNKLDKVDPFATGDSLAKFKSNLSPGSYRAEFRIYKGEEVVKSGDTTLSVLPAGTLDNTETVIRPLIIILGSVVILLILLALIFGKKTLKNKKFRCRLLSKIFGKK